MCSVDSVECKFQCVGRCAIESNFIHHCFTDTLTHCPHRQQLLTMKQQQKDAELEANKQAVLLVCYIVYGSDCAARINFRVILSCALKGA